MQIGGLLTALVLGALIGVLFWRERRARPIPAAPAQTTPPPPATVGEDVKTKHPVG